jgi:hypothetical protein
MERGEADALFGTSQWRPAPALRAGSSACSDNLAENLRWTLQRDFESQSTRTALFRHQPGSRGLDGNGKLSFAKASERRSTISNDSCARRMLTACPGKVGTGFPTTTPAAQRRRHGPCICLLTPATRQTSGPNVRLAYRPRPAGRLTSARHRYTQIPAAACLPGGRCCAGPRSPDRP